MVSLILHIIIIFICIFFILLLGLLVIPFDYNFNGYVNESIYGKGIVKWLFGLTKFTIYKEKEESHIKVKFNLCGLSIPVSKAKKNNGTARFIVSDAEKEGKKTVLVVEAKVKDGKITDITSKGLISEGNLDFPDT